MATKAKNMKTDFFFFCWSFSSNSVHLIKIVVAHVGRVVNVFHIFGHFDMAWNSTFDSLMYIEQQKLHTHTHTHGGKEKSKKNCIQNGLSVILIIISFYVFRPESNVRSRSDSFIWRSFFLFFH